MFANPQLIFAHSLPKNNSPVRKNRTKRYLRPLLSLTPSWLGGFRIILARENHFKLYLDAFSHRQIEFSIPSACVRLFN